MPSPFSCFSPSNSYDETLPRSFHNNPQLYHHPHYSPTGAAALKASIGLPYNFIHHGHVGPDTVQNQEELSSALASISLALSSSGTSPFPPIPPSPSPSSSAQPFTDLSNSHSSPAPTEPQPLVQKKRKPPPMVTASVIRQAGREVVDATGGSSSSSPGAGLRARFVPPPVPSVPVAKIGTATEESKPDEKKKEGVDEEEKEKTQELPQPPEKDVSHSTEESLPVPPTTTGAEGEKLPYATETGKLRWDGAMKDIEAALREA